MGQVLRKVTKEERELKFEASEENFTKNGGILLQKQIALRKGQDIGPRQLKFFSSQEVQTATNCYDPDLILGSNDRGIVYKGILDHRTVAIRSPPESNPNLELIDHILTEVSTGMVLGHDNMVKLYGCCLETYIPMPVYEFLPNKTLSHYLHGDGGLAISNSLKWTDRLCVAADMSYALSYMHNALPEPVVHRDVRSDAILLDDSLHAKLSDFGYSVQITPGESSQRWPVQGTLGYIDPEYVETRKVTDKCDVYSFGILMLEILTRRQPFTMAKDGLDLVDAFVSSVGRNCMMEMVDKEVLEQVSRSEIERFAKLALKCVAKKGIQRPTMIEVVDELWLIQGKRET